MKKSVFEKKKFVVSWLIPKVRKSTAAFLYAARETQWRAFAEGCLRNLYFHEHVIKRGPKCMGCNKRFNSETAAIASRIEKHHNTYMRMCIGSMLPAGSADIYRLPEDGEFQATPDCRACHKNNPAYFEGCVKCIFPVHAECHEDIHELERYFYAKKKKKILADFENVARITQQ